MQFTRFTKVSGVAFDLRPQIINTLSNGGSRKHNWRSPAASVTEIQHQFQVPTGAAGIGTIGLVHHENVGDFQESGLVGLHRVAPAWGDHHNGGVGSGGDRHFYLANTNGFHEDRVTPGSIEQANGVWHCHRKSAGVASGGHRPNEGVAADVVVHADSVTEDGTPCQGRTGSMAKTAGLDAPETAVRRPVIVDLPALGHL